MVDDFVILTLTFVKKYRCFGLGCCRGHQCFTNTSCYLNTTRFCKYTSLFLIRFYRRREFNRRVLILSSQPIGPNLLCLGDLVCGTRHGNSSFAGAVISICRNKKIYVTIEILIFLSGSIGSRSSYTLFFQNVVKLPTLLYTDCVPRAPVREVSSRVYLSYLPIV